MKLLICARRKLKFAIKLFLQMIICSNQQSITHLRELNKNCIITGFIKWCRIVCGKIAYCEEAVDHFKMWKRLTSWVNLERLAGLGWLASGWSAEARQLGLPSVVLLWLSGGWLAFTFFLSLWIWNSEASRPWTYELSDSYRAWCPRCAGSDNEGFWSCKMNQFRSKIT